MSRNKVEVFFWKPTVGESAKKIEQLWRETDGYREQNGLGPIRHVHVRSRQAPAVPAPTGPDTRALSCESQLAAIRCTRCEIWTG